jgi:hypothetical protein
MNIKKVSFRGKSSFCFALKIYWLILLMDGLEWFLMEDV